MGIAGLGRRLLRSRALNDSLWSLIGAITQRGFTFVTIVLLARVMGKEGFGLFSMFQVTIGMFQAASILGVNRISTRYVAELVDTDPDRLKRILGLTQATALTMAAVSCTVFLLFGRALTDVGLRGQFDYRLMIAGATLVVLGALDSEQTGIYFGLRDYRGIARVNLLSGLFSIIAVVLSATQFGLTGAVQAMAATAVLRYAVSSRYIRKVLNERGVSSTLRGSWDERRLLSQFGLPFALSSVLLGFSAWASRSFLVGTPGGLSEVATLGAAVQLQALVMLLSSYASQPILPMLVSKNSKDSPQVWAANMLVPLGMGVAFCVPFMLLPEVFFVIFGSEFAGRKLGETIVLVVLGTGFMLYGQAFGRVQVVKAQMWQSFALNVLNVSVLLSGVWTLRGYGAPGFALASLTASMVQTFASIPTLLKGAPHLRSLVWSLEMLAFGFLFGGAAIPYFVQAPLWVRGLLVIPMIGMGAALLYLQFRKVSGQGPRSDSVAASSEEPVADGT